MDSWNNQTMNHYDWGTRTGDDPNDDSWNLLSYNNNTNTYDNEPFDSEKHIKDILDLISDTHESCESDDDSSYAPSHSSDSESISEEDDNISVVSLEEPPKVETEKTTNTKNDTYQEDEEWLEMYDEKRQDTDGGWYTRRQFYDYYGSDEAWDNLDPDIYHQYRFDTIYGEWHCKEEFYQHYGTNDIWKKMNPKRHMRRRVTCDIYHWASYLPDRLQDSFIKRMLQTYDFYV